jgi:hypothetical protein
MLDRYAYVRNNSLRYVDPTGLGREELMPFGEALRAAGVPEQKRSVSRPVSLETDPLNAAHPYTSPPPAIDTPAEVIAAFQAAFDSGDYETTKNMFKDANEAGCPMDACGKHR